MLSDEWLSRYGLLENFNASVTRTRTGTGTWTTGVTAIALCTLCSRAKNAGKLSMMILFKCSNCCKTVFDHLRLVCRICVKYQYPCRAVCAYAGFLNRPGCALIGACALIIINTVFSGHRL